VNEIMYDNDASWQFANYAMDEESIDSASWLMKHARNVIIRELKGQALEWAKQKEADEENGND